MSDDDRDVPGPSCNWGRKAEARQAKKRSREAVVAADLLSPLEVLEQAKVLQQLRWALGMEKMPKPWPKR